MALSTPQQSTKLIALAVLGIWCWGEHAAAFHVGAEVPENSSGHMVSDDGEDGESADEARHVLRIVISATRSGSTALLHCFANNPHVDLAWHQPIKSGYRENGTFSYEVFKGEGTVPAGEKRVWVAKETIGGFFRAEASFSPFPSSEVRDDSLMVGRWVVSRKSIQRLKPLVLIRDPLQVWNSIKKLNKMSAGVSKYHSHFDYFVDSYSAVAEFLFAAKEIGLPVFAVTQEMLGAAPQKVLPRICDKFGIPYSDAMVQWTEQYGSKTWFSEEALERFRSDPRFQHSKLVLKNSTHYDYRPSKVNILDEDKAVIEKQLLPLYAKAAAFAEADFGDIAPVCS